MVVTGLEMVSFSSSLKKRNGKECADYCATAIISYASKIMLKSFKLGFGSLWRELPDVQAAFRKSTPLQYSCLENPMDGGAW